MGNFYLSDRGFIQNDIHYKYNFILSSKGLIHDYFIFHHAQVSYINGSIYQNILYFSSNITLNISNVGDKSSLIIRLNKEGENLYCEDVCEESKIITCIVHPKTILLKLELILLKLKIVLINLLLIIIYLRLKFIYQMMIKKMKIQVIFSIRRLFLLIMICLVLL